jgi:hypothetical protein
MKTSSGKAKGRRFQNIGTEKVGVGQCAKMGTMSLEGLVTYHNDYQPKEKNILSLNEVIHDGEFKNDKIYVIVLRDVFDKWKSGYWMELQNNNRPFSVSNVLEFFNKNIYKNGFRKNSSAVNTALEVMTLLHDPKSPTGNSWMFKGHGQFWKWNNFNEIPLSIYAQLPNIYFLELKDLSNPKFLKWLCEQDSDWECVTEIPHKNKSCHQDIFWKQMELFWAEYNDEGGLILQDKVLVCPFSNKYPPVAIMNIFRQEQMRVDFIRENHKRYLKFD